MTPIPPICVEAGQGAVGAFQIFSKGFLAVGALAGVDGAIGVLVIHETTLWPADGRLFDPLQHRFVVKITIGGIVETVGLGEGGFDNGFKFFLFLFILDGQIVQEPFVRCLRCPRITHLLQKFSWPPGFNICQIQE